MDYAIIGIGVNVAVCINSLPSEIKDICGTLLDPDHIYVSEAREVLFVFFLRRFSLFYRQFISGDFLGILQSVKKYCGAYEMEDLILELEHRLH